MNPNGQLDTGRWGDPIRFPVRDTGPQTEELCTLVNRDDHVKADGLEDPIGNLYGLDAPDGAPESIRSLEGTELHKAVAKALVDENYKRTRGALVAMGPYRQDIAHATAFAGHYGSFGMEVVVVVIPFPDQNRPHTKSGLVAFVTAGEDKAVSYCILEKAESPSESGAIRVENQLGDQRGESLWLWEPPSDEDTGPTGGAGTTGEIDSSGEAGSVGETESTWERGSIGALDPTDGSKAKKYFKCVFRNTAIGCGFCVSRCVVSLLLYIECMKNCCGAALGFAMIACAVEMMIP
jgi:hypothetical protein